MKALLVLVLVLAQATQPNKPKPPLDPLEPGHGSPMRDQDQSPEGSNSRQPKPRATVVHQATVNWSNNSCTTAKPCSIQVYRATCSGSCPQYPNSAYTAPPVATLAVTANVTSTQTSWQVVDSDSALADSTTYAWVATNTFSSNPGNPGPSSAPWSGTTGAAAQIPVAPSVGSGNSIQ